MVWVERNNSEPTQNAQCSFVAFCRRFRRAIKDKKQSFFGVVIRPRLCNGFLSTVLASNKRFHSLLIILWLHFKTFYTTCCVWPAFILQELLTQPCVFNQLLAFKTLWVNQLSASKILWHNLLRLTSFQPSRPCGTTYYIWSLSPYRTSWHNVLRLTGFQPIRPCDTTCYIWPAFSL